MRAVATMALLAGGLAIFAAYLISALVTDRVASLQQLWWLPRPLLAGTAFVLLTAGLWSAARSPRPRRLALFAAVLAGGAFLHAFTREFGLPRAGVAGSVRLAHWNAAWVAERDAARAVDAVLALDSDVIVVANPGRLLADGGLERVQAAGYDAHRPGRFLLLSRMEVREARPLVESRDARAAVRFEVQTRFGPLRIDAIDLPSDPSIGRFRTVELLASELSAARGAAPDLFVGDFNITRGSASLAQLAPDARDAFLTAGAGWGGTFPRTSPWLAIDLALVRPPWRTVRADVRDPGLGRHRLQVVELVCERESSPTIK